MFSNIYFEGKCLKNISATSNLRAYFFVTKCFNTSILHTLKAFLSKNWLYFFFLIFWYARIPPCFRIPHCWHYFFTFLKCFAFFKFNMSSQKSDKNNSIRVIFMKIIIKINIIKIYINNTHLITRKFDITRIFIKEEYIFICVEITQKFLQQTNRE